MIDLKRVEELQVAVTDAVNERLMAKFKLTGEQIVPREFFCALLLVADSVRQSIMDGDSNPLSLTHEVNKAVWDITIARLNACGKLKEEDGE